jgi:hypothetical protein
MVIPPQYNCSDINLNGDRLRDRLMGEEKPDEELMGKRKSSPRLSTTFFYVDNTRIDGLKEKYTSIGQFFVFGKWNVVR